ncbi:MAG: hypothetical protein LBC80_01110, partial [Treponema sp.]|nr:hypothetical protein [Treponema sp.]
MKNLITTITFAFFFFLFSCAGTDKINNELIEEIDEQQALLELTDETDSQIEMVVEIEIDMETEYEQTEPIEIIPDETLVQPLEEPVQPIVQEQQPVQPIVQEQQPVQPIVQEQPEVQPLRQEEPQEEPSALPLLPPDLLAADAADRNDTVRETLHIEPWRDFPSAPATRIESPNQMGLVPQNNDIVFSRVVRVT